MERLKIDKRGTILTKSVCVESSPFQLLILDKNVTFLWHIEIPFSAFKKREEGQSVFPIFAIFQVPLTRNSQYAKVYFDYLGMVCSELLHYSINKGISCEEIHKMVQMCGAMSSCAASQVHSTY